LAPSIYKEWISSYGATPPNTADMKWTRRLETVKRLAEKVADFLISFFE
jgi:hypothetical protein